ncbi:MAG: M23 family metallopeptidase [Promethearchaeota archaeon]
MPKLLPTSYPKLRGFLSSHRSKDEVASITTEPDPIYFEDGRDSLKLNFDFIVRGLTERNLQLKFMKAGVYDSDGNLLTFRHLNHNGVGTPGIHTIGRYELEGRDTLDIFNPFFRFPNEYPLDHLRYMFTFFDVESKDEFYYGNIIVKPIQFKQKVTLSLPMRGILTVLDGHDFYSHHRRFAMSIVREFTSNKFYSNFSRYALDFTVVGSDGNTREMLEDEYRRNYDFHFDDITKFYTHGAHVFAPAGGEIVDIVSGLEDLYESKFNLESSVKKNTIEEIAGNYVVIKHNEHEYSHLFHLMKDSVKVKIGDTVNSGDFIAKVGFSGASTTYSHLHYQLMNGKDFLNDNPLPCKFSNVRLMIGSKSIEYDTLPIDTGDFVTANR